MKAQPTMTADELVDWERELREGSAVDWTSFHQALTSLINRYNIENSSSGTPDFILSEYLMDCLRAWNKNVIRREKWYGWERGKPSGSADG